jgi:hypothetical protein
VVAMLVQPNRRTVPAPVGAHLQRMPRPEVVQQRPRSTRTIPRPRRAMQMLTAIEAPIHRSQHSLILMGRQTIEKSHGLVLGLSVMVHLRPGRVIAKVDHGRFCFPVFCAFVHHSLPSPKSVTVSFFGLSVPLGTRFVANFAIRFASASVYSFCLSVVRGIGLAGQYRDQRAARQDHTCKNQHPHGHAPFSSSAIKRRCAKRPRSTSDPPALPPATFYPQGPRRPTGQLPGGNGTKSLGTW